MLAGVGCWCLSPGKGGRRVVPADQQSVGAGREGEGGEPPPQGRGQLRSPHRFAWEEPRESAHTWEDPELWCISPAPPSPPWCRATGNISAPANISIMFSYPR